MQLLKLSSVSILLVLFFQESVGVPSYIHLHANSYFSISHLRVFGAKYCLNNQRSFFVMQVLMFCVELVYFLHLMQSNKEVGLGFLYCSYLESYHSTRGFYCVNVWIVSKVSRHTQTLGRRPLAQWDVLSSLQVPENKYSHCFLLIYFHA